jgi:hypothetical protein
MRHHEVIEEKIFSIPIIFIRRLKILINCIVIKKLVEYFCYES